MASSTIAEPAVAVTFAVAYATVTVLPLSGESVIVNAAFPAPELPSATVTSPPAVNDGSGRRD